MENENYSNSVETYEELLDQRNTKLVRRLEKITLYTSIALFISSIVFLFIGLFLSKDGILWDYIILFIVSFISALIGPIAVEWMAATLETLNNINNKL